MVFFCSPSQADLWNRNKPKQVFLDGYFKVPSPFVQLVTLAGYYDFIKCTVPIIHCLVNSRSSEAYDHILCESEHILREIICDKTIILKPEILTIDFEQALLKSVKHNFPESKIHGCLVHYIRALLTNLKKLGLTGRKYKSTAYEVLSLLTLLAWVPINKVKIIFKDITKQKRFQGFLDFFNYFEDTWLDGIYEIKLWNIEDKIKNSPDYFKHMHHSNNAIESFHFLLNFVLLKSPKPTIKEFVDALAYLENRKMNEVKKKSVKGIIEVKIIS